MNCCPLHSQVDAFHDGELAPAEAEQFRQHLPTCEPCRQALEEMNQISQVLSAAPPVSQIELVRIHQAVDRTAAATVAESSFFRFAGVMGALAASILVISGVWLAETPSAAPRQSLTEPVILSYSPDSTLNANQDPSESSVQAAEVDVANWMVHDLQTPASHASNVGR